jgi:alkylhydroperoxidase/carboxymuconolactone decarboxylase family protein YurZ
VPRLEAFTEQRAIMITLDELRSEAIALLKDAPAGHVLDEKTAALIGLAVCMSVTALDGVAAEIYADRALDAGATGAQLHETLVLVSGLGVHTLMEGSKRIANILRVRDYVPISAPLDEVRQKLWARFVGSDRYWEAMENAVPGFLDALLRQSPEAFEAFFVYCAVPWKTTALPTLTKELMSMAVDAAPTHRYAPGMRLHLANALRLGAGKTAILQALDIAAQAPVHSGVR